MEVICKRRTVVWLELDRRFQVRECLRVKHMKNNSEEEREGGRRKERLEFLHFDRGSVKSPVQGQFSSFTLAVVRPSKCLESLL